MEGLQGARPPGGNRQNPARSDDTPQFGGGRRWVAGEIQPEHADDCVEGAVREEEVRHVATAELDVGQTPPGRLDPRKIQQTVGKVDADDPAARPDLPCGFKRRRAGTATHVQYTVVRAD